MDTSEVLQDWLTGSAVGVEMQPSDQEEVMSETELGDLLVREITIDGMCGVY